MIFVCWQDWRDIREEIVVAMIKGCHDVGLRKQHTGYHNSWNCWYFILLVWFGVLHGVDVGSAY